MKRKKQQQTDEERYRQLVEHVSDWIWEVDENGVYTYASPQIKDILGFSPNEVIGKTPFDLMSADEAKRVKPIFDKLLSKNLPIKSLENLNIHRDGREVILETSGSPIINKEGKCIGYRGVDRDITARKIAERRNQQLLDIIDASPDFIATADINGDTKYINPAGRRMLGLRGNERISIAAAHLQPYQDTILHIDIPTAIQQGVWKSETMIFSQDGIEIPVSQIIVAHKSETGDVQFLSTIARDITERKELEKIIDRQANYDTLTDLPNRRFFQNKLSSIFEASIPGQKVAILFIDLDNFKNINDTYGHRIGDQLLQLTAARLSDCVRKHDFICRFGGDEFIILLESIKDESEIEHVAKRIIQEFHHPFFIDGLTIEATGSIGISIYPNHGQDEETLVKKADQAMYKIKRQGKDNYQVNKE